jgi:hypothetical protein
VIFDMKLKPCLFTEKCFLNGFLENKFLKNELFFNI